MNELSSAIKVWIKRQPGAFRGTDIDEAFNLADKKEKNLRRQITHRLVVSHYLQATDTGAFKIHPRAKLVNIRDSTR